MSALAVFVLATTAAQFGPPPEPVGSVFSRPVDGERLPEGGLIVATIILGQEADVRRGRLDIEHAIAPPGREDEEKRSFDLFGRCVRQSEWCIWRARLPFGDPAPQSSVRIQVEGSEGASSSVADVEIISPDITPPRGLDSFNVVVEQSPPGLAQNGWRYFVAAGAVDLDDDSGIALLELYDTSDDDEDLLGHVVAGPDQAPGETEVFAEIDVPENAVRCYRLDATDLGGNVARSEERCFDIVVLPGCSHTAAPTTGSASGASALLVLGWFSRRRSTRAGRARGRGQR